MKDNRNFREIQKTLRLVGIEARKANGREYLRVRVPGHPHYVLSIANLGDGWFTEVDQPGILADDYQAVREDVAAFRERIRIAIESSCMDETESPVIESSAAGHEESNPTECQSPEVLQGEGLGGAAAAAPEAPGEEAITPGGKPCPECEGTGMCQGDLQAFNEGKEGCPCWDEVGITEGGETLGEGCPDDGVCWKCDGSGFVAANEEAPGEESEIDRELRAFAGEMKAFRQSFEDALAGDGEAPGENEIASIEEEGAGPALVRFSLAESLCILCSKLGVEVAWACRLATGKPLLHCSIDELKLLLNRITEPAEWIGGIDDPIPEEDLDEGEKAANDYGKQFISDFLQRENAIAPVTEGILVSPEQVGQVAGQLGFEYWFRDGNHLIARETFFEGYKKADDAIARMREVVLVDAEKHLLKTSISSLCYEMSMSKQSADNICVSVTGNSIEDCSLDDLKIFLNRLRYIEKVALGSHQDNRHTD